MTTRAHLNPTLTDAELIAAVAARDQLALATVYDRHGPTVYSLACRIVSTPQIAEEIVQEVFLRLWNEPHRFDPTRGALRSFLYREAHSRSIERIRSEQARCRREERVDREEARPDLDVAQDAWHHIRRERIATALLELSVGEREAIDLAYFGGHTYREVAVMLGIAEGTVKSRIRLGLQKLARHLGDLELEETA